MGGRARGGRDRGRARAIVNAHGPLAPRAPPPQDKSWLDGHYAAENEAQWAKREAKWGAEAAARARLTEETAAAQRAQVAERASGDSLSSRHDAQMIAAWRAGNVAAEEREAAKQRAKREQALRDAELVKAQMEANAERRAAEKQREYLDYRAAQKFEAEYDAKVQTLLHAQGAGTRRR